MYYIGKPINWQIGLQKSATPIMKQTIQLMHYTNILLLPIVGAIPIIIIYLCIKYSDDNNSCNKLHQINSNIVLEIIWTSIPIAILTSICVPSFKSLKYQMMQKKYSYITIKITAHQWYWNYEYFVKKKFCFNSNILKSSQRDKFKKISTEIYPELLATDYELIIPARRVVRLLIISADVIHAFTVPSFGIKVDAIPGKINDAWVKVDNPGIYYGQCSEFCGKDHAFMPIAVRVVSQEMFDNWIKIASINIDNAFSILNVLTYKNK